jgi:hypothetical protein
MKNQNYRLALSKILSNNSKRNDVMALFEQYMEIESDNAEAAACDALYELDLDYLIPKMNSYVKTLVN